MTHLAPHAHVTPRIRTELDDLLQLNTGGLPATVFLTVLSNSGTSVVLGFGLHPTGPWHHDGLTWMVNPEYGQMLNFVFVASAQPGTIVEIEPEPPAPGTARGFWVSKPVTQSVPNQQGCVDNVLDGLTHTYKFHVAIANGSAPVVRVDPKIVVTPQTL